MGYFSTQKGYTSYHSSIRKFYISTSVTFAKKDNYFTDLYLQGEKSFVEDKDRDSFLLYLLMLSKHYSSPVCESSIVTNLLLTQVLVNKSTSKSSIDHSF